MNEPRGESGAAAPFGATEHPSADPLLLHRITRGDEAAMASLYREHGRIVFAQVLLVCGDRVLAEEIVQDTMLAVWRGARSFRGESSVRAWIIAIARRQTRDRLRRRRLQVLDDGALAERPGTDVGPEAMALDRAELAEVQVAISALAVAHREVLGLALCAGLSLPEVAALLEIPVGTVKSRLSAARVALNRKLEEMNQSR